MKYFNFIIGVFIIGGAIWVFVAQKKDPVDSDPQLPPPVIATGGPESKPKTESKPLTKSKTITTKEGMKIEIIKEGSGESIINGQRATVDYVGKLTDGSIFDASKNHGTTGFSFSLGAGQVIKGWDQGVLGMKVGETRVLTIPSDLAYGANGIPGVIPGGATLIFEVTLLSIQ